MILCTVQYLNHFRDEGDCIITLAHLQSFLWRYLDYKSLLFSDYLGLMHLFDAAPKSRWIPGQRGAH